jgi:hypothetical protein
VAGIVTGRVATAMDRGSRDIASGDMRMKSAVRGAPLPTNPGMREQKQPEAAREGNDARPPNMSLRQSSKRNHLSAALALVYTASRKAARGAGTIA